MYSICQKIIKGCLSVLLVMALALPIIPQYEAKAANPVYPVLPPGLSYYKTTFPAGLRYSKGWYGTFSYAPRAYDVYLFDDDWSNEFGLAVFAMAPGLTPSGAQGGTVLTSITRDEADNITKSYTLDESVKPFDAEIEQVMPLEAFFTGAWAGDKLRQKWNYGKAGIRAPDQLTDRQKQYLAAIKGKPIKTVDLSLYDPDRFWVGGSGNWTDNVTHWSAASGGAPGASLPTSADNTFFDANSFTAPGQTVTIDAAANTLSMDWTGATNTPTFASGGNLINIYGSLTFILDMVRSGSYTHIEGGGVGRTLTTNGLALNGSLSFGSGFTGSITLVDSLNVTLIDFYNGTFITGGNTITTDTFQMTDTNARTLTLGASVINSTAWIYSGSNVTLTANTATINVAGTGAFNGGNLTTYNIVNLVGSAHTISGNNTLVTLGTNSTIAQTITFTDGTNQTATNFNLSGTSGFQHTLQGTGAGGWNLIKAADNVTADYVTLSNSIASGGATFNAVGGSVDGGGNTGWNFPLTVSTGAASGISMDRDGVTAVTVAGTITDMGGSATVGAWWDYSTGGGAIASTSNVTWATTNFTGSKTTTLPTNLTPGATYSFRRAVTSGANTTYGANATFTFTMPSVTTNAATAVSFTDITRATLNADITNLGVASDTYAYFEWGTTGSYGSNTTEVVVNAIGVYSATITGYVPDTVYHYRAVNRVGSVYSYGSDSTFSVAATASFSLNNLLPLVFITFIIVVMIKLMISGEISPVLGILLVAVAVYVGNALLVGMVEIIRRLFGG